ncbi:diguanylate cyclase [Bacillota bacterium Meth-B3]
MKRLIALVAACLTLLCGAAQVFAYPVRSLPNAAPLELSEMFIHRGDVMFMVDPEDGEILWANRAAAVFYGYSEIGMRRLRYADIVATPLDQMEGEMRLAQEQGRDHYRLKHRHSSGREIDVQMSAYPVIYKNRGALLAIVHDKTDVAELEADQLRLTRIFAWVGGALTVLMAALLVVTLRGRAKIRRAYRTLETVDALRNAFFEASDDIMYLKDEEMKYLFVNGGVEKLYGRPADEIVGLDDYELSSRAFADLRNRSDVAVVETRAPVRDEIEWDGRSFSSVKFPVSMPDGCMGIGVIARDVTRERAEEKCRAMMYRRHEILADVMVRGFHSEDEQLRYALGEALELTGSGCGYIYRYNHAARAFSHGCWTGGPVGADEDWQPRTEFSLDDGGVWAEVASGGKPLILNDLYPRDSNWLGCPSNCSRCRRFAAVPVIFDERIVAVVGVGQKTTDYDELDVSELSILMNGVWNAVRRREVEERMNFERARYLKTLVSIGDGVLVVDGEGRVEMLNPVAERLSGWTSAEAVGHHYRDVLSIEHEDAGRHISDVIAAALTKGEVQELSNHAVLVSRQGTRCNLEDSAAPIHGEDGKVEGVVMVFRDVTHRKQQRRRIEYLSFHDALTGLYNRRFFNEELRRLDTPRNLPLAVIMGDVNGLKLTNDIFGHAAGDTLLERIAQVLKRVCRADDIVARWGGDEFVLLLPKTEAATAFGIVARTKEEFAKERIQAIKGSISMGVAVKRTAEEDVDRVLSTAEEVMYNNKVLGRDEARSSTIGEILRTLHLESPRERAHADQVSALCVSLGRALNLPPEELHKLREIGRLHDIGKITLDRETLCRAGELSERELSEMRRHPIVGYRLLSTFDDTIDLAPAVLAHHEHWNGSGFPKGLVGEEIPLNARILAICEVYERRLWEAGGDAQAQARVLAYMREQIGARFEPRLAEAFIDMIERERQGEIA